MRRTPLDEALRMYSILGPPLPTPAASVAQRLGDRKANRSQPASSETARLGENSGVRA
jgi:hypothetical protein